MGQSMRQKGRLFPRKNFLFSPLQPIALAGFSM